MITVSTPTLPSTDSGLDLKFVDWVVPSQVIAGELVPVDMTVGVVIIGPLGMPPKQVPDKNYDVTFQLVNNIDKPKQGAFSDLFFTGAAFTAHDTAYSAVMLTLFCRKTLTCIMMKIGCSNVQSHY